MQPPPLRSDHIVIKDLQCADKYDGRTISYHITSRLGAAGVQMGRFGRPKIQLSSKRQNLQGRLELILRSSYARMTFFVKFLAFEI